VLLLAVAAGAVVLAAAVARDDGPRRASDGTGAAVSGRATTTVRPAPTTIDRAPATTTTVAAVSGASAEAVGSGSDAPPESPGLVITNSGVATASVGGNVVSGAGPTATVVTGDATAIGNSSSVRTP
jgi:hypothetical protein